MKTLIALIIATIGLSAQNAPLEIKTDPETVSFANNTISVHAGTTLTTPYVTVSTKLSDGIMEVVYGPEAKQHTGTINLGSIEKDILDFQAIQNSYANRIAINGLIRDLLECESENLDNTTAQMIAESSTSVNNTTIHYRAIRVGTTITPEYKPETGRIVLHIQHTDLTGTTIVKGIEYPETRTIIAELPI